MATLKTKQIFRFMQALGYSEADLRETDQWVRVTPCPLAAWKHHNGKDSKPSFSISISDGPSVFNCFGCLPDVKPLGYLLHLLWLFTGKYPKAAAAILLGSPDEFIPFDELRDFRSPYENERPKLVPLSDKILKLYPLLADAKGIEARLEREFLASRGISPQTFAKLGVRYSYDRKGLIFPYTDKNGDIFHLYFRSRMSKTMYMINKEMAQEDSQEDLSEELFFTKKDTGAWFGLHLIDWNKPVMIVEGECFPGDTEVLTTDGWVRFSDYREQPVFQVHTDLSGNFALPTARIYKFFHGDLVRHESKGYVSITTPKHQMVAYGSNGEMYKHYASDGPMSRHHHIPRVATANGPGIDLTDDQLRLCIAVSADAAIDQRKGNYNYKPKEMRYARMGFKKERKIIRIVQLLRSTGLSFSNNPMPSQSDYRSVCFPVPSWIPGRLFPHAWLAQLSLRQKRLFIDELGLWDGNAVPNRNQIEYSTRLLQNAIFVQTLAHLSGYVSSIIRRKNSFGRWFKVSILFGKDHSNWQAIKTSSISYDGPVYCVTVPSGMLLVRQEEKIHITGNCDQMRIVELGFSNVIASGGTSASKRQIEELTPLQLLLGYDADKPGEQATERFLKYLPFDIPTYTLDWSLAKKSRNKRCKDGGDLPDADSLQQVIQGFKRAR